MKIMRVQNQKAYTRFFHSKSILNRVSIKLRFAKTEDIASSSFYLKHLGKCFGIKSRILKKKYFGKDKHFMTISKIVIWFLKRQRGCFVKTNIFSNVCMLNYLYVSNENLPEMVLFHKSF